MQILLCSDLDRTILPNGHQEESPQARPLLRELAAHPQVHLAYVSGRSRDLLQEAIREYAIPVPDYAIGDVGTTIYEIKDNSWRLWKAWHTEIGSDWQGVTWEKLAPLFADIAELTLQEKEKQNAFKLSYYAPTGVDRAALLAEVKKRLAARNIRANLIFSIDEVKDRAFLDILPAAANKLHAITFLMKRKGFRKQHTVFAGDSGNDLPVLTSGLQAVLVKNATDEVRAEALQLAEQQGALASLYCAQGGFLAMNGNYAAGVLEGLAHFIPQTENWLAAAKAR